MESFLKRFEGTGDKLNAGLSDLSSWAKRKAEEAREVTVKEAAYRAAKNGLQAASSYATAAAGTSTLNDAESTCNASSPPSLTPEQRIARFQKLLAQKVVPFDKFQKAVFTEGVPEQSKGSMSLRAVSWKLLLSYLPPDRSQWQEVLKERRRAYAAFCEELTVDPGESEGAPTSAAIELDAAAHPLTDDVGSKWHQWHADEELRHEIKKDVDRTLPDYSFFNREQPLGRLHAVAISRILFIYAKLNPGIKYVQGMNEVLAPLYFVFCQEIDDAQTPSPPASPPSQPKHDEPLLPSDPPLCMATTTDEDPLEPAAAVATAASEQTTRAIADAASRVEVIDANASDAASSLDDPLSALLAASDADVKSSKVSTGSEGLDAAVAVPAAAAVETPTAPNVSGCLPCDSSADQDNSATDSTADPAADVSPALLSALDDIEADAFFCFTNLMAEIRDHFCSKLDHTELGITAKITRMEKLIEAKDPELGRMLKRLRVAPTFYGFRWITLLSTQEWDLPDVLHLWDSLLADPHRFDFLLYFCVATVISIRDDLLENDDFAFAVKALQRFDGRVPMHALLHRAHAYYSEDGKE